MLTREEIEKLQEESYRKSGKNYYEAALRMYSEAQKARSAMERQTRNLVPDWFRATGIPIVFTGTYHTPYIFMTCPVKFHTIVWDRNYGCGAPQMGWKPVDRPLIMVDVRIPIYLAATDPNGKGIMFDGSDIMASQTMPHSHAGGNECFVGVSGATYLKTFKDYEILRGRITNHLGGANLASLASHWGDWSDELKACFPNKLAEVIARESLAGADPNVISGATEVAPDYTMDDLEELSWRNE